MTSNPDRAKALADRLHREIDDLTLPELDTLLLGELDAATQEAVERCSIDHLAKTVGKWHRSIFGEYDPSHHVQAIGQKAEEEARELHEATSRIQMRLEVTDLLICGLAAADRLGIDPSEIVHEKLKILESRGMDQLKRDKDRGIMQASERVIRESATNP